MDAHAAPEEPRSDNYKWKAFSVMALGLFFGVMDFGGTGVAIPTIAADLGLELRRASLIVIAFSLAISAVLLPVGGLSDLAGRRRSFIAGGLIYALGAAATAAAPDLTTIVIARVVQAVGAAVVMANGMAIVAVVFPAGERGKAMGLITAAVGIGSVSGPIVAGVMIDLAGWRSFFVLLAVGTGLAVVWSWIILDESRIGTKSEGSVRRYDWWGALLSIAALTLLISVVTNSDSLDPGMLTAGIIGTVILVALFIVRENRAAVPMFDLGAFLSSQFSWAISARFLGFLGTSTTFFLMPFYLQDIQDYEPSEVGLITFPGALGFALMGSVSGRLSDRLGVKPFTVSGLTLVVVGGLLLASLNEDSGLIVIMPALLISGLGMGLWIAPNMSAAIDAVSSRSYGVISAFINLVRNTASVIGIAIATAVVVGVMQHRGLPADLGILGDLGDDPEGAAIKDAFVVGMRIAFLVFASIAAVAIIPALRTRNPRRHGRSADVPEDQRVETAEAVMVSEDHGAGRSGGESGVREAGD